MQPSLVRQEAQPRIERKALFSGFQRGLHPGPAIFGKDEKGGSQVIVLFDPTKLRLPTSEPPTCTDLSEAVLRLVPST